MRARPMHRRPQSHYNSGNLINANTMSIRRIFFTQLALDARIGILEHELRATQPLHIDAEFDVDVTHQVHDQDIQTVLDYRQLRGAIVSDCTQAHVNLLETLYERVASSDKGRAGERCVRT